mgnify:CR=1 FL=1
MIESVTVISFTVVLLVFMSVLYGMLKQENKPQKKDLQAGEKIDKIISDNSNIADDHWDKWLQERRDKQK